jgi:hypothetical protein
MCPCHLPWVKKGAQECLSGVALTHLTSPPHGRHVPSLVRVHPISMEGTSPPHGGYIPSSRVPPKLLYAGFSPRDKEGTFFPQGLGLLEEDFPHLWTMCVPPFLALGPLDWPWPHPKTEYLVNPEYVVFPWCEESAPTY